MLALHSKSGMTGSMAGKRTIEHLLSTPCKDDSGMNHLELSVVVVGDGDSSVAMAIAFRGEIADRFGDQTHTIDLLAWPGAKDE